jgi:DNA-binding CsgD family transcriptional regulator
MTRLIGPLDGRAAADAEALVQRQGALGVCDRAFDSVGIDGPLLVFEGAAGAGKSAMLRAACAMAQSRGMRILRAAGSQFERQCAYGVVRQLFEPPLLRANGAERDVLLGGAARPAAAALGLAPPGDDSEHAINQGLFRLLVGMAAEHGLLLAVDDLDLADDASLAFLRYLAPRQPGHRLATVVSLTPGVAERDPPASLLHIERAATVIGLDPLDATGVAELLLRAGRSARAEECEELTRLTGGNPFLVGSVIESGGPVPTAVTRDLALRLVGLSNEARLLARSAAVLGDGASVAVAARAMGVRPGVALDALDELAKVGVLRRSGMVAFSAPLLRSALYSMLGHGERSRLHRRAARALALAGAPTAAAAEHLMRVEGAGEAWATEVLRNAAHEATTPADTAAYLRRALAEEPPAHARAALLAELAANELSGNSSDAARHLAEAVDLLPPGTERAHACEQLARLLWGLGRYAEASGAFAEGLDELGGRGGGVAARLSAGCAAAGRVLRDAGHRGLPRLDLSALSSPSHEPAAGAVLALELVLAGGDRDRAAELAGRALADGLLLREQTSGGPAYQAAVCALVWADELDAAEHAATLGITDAEQRGMEPALGVMLLLRGCARFRRGPLPEACEDALAAGVRAPTLLPVPLPPPAALLAEIRLHQGRLGEAGEAAGIALDARGGRVQHALALSTRARVALAEGDPRAALADLLECGSRLREAEVRNPAVAPWRSLAATAALRLGERDRAAELVAEERALADLCKQPRPAGLALAASAASRGRDERIAELRAAAAELERSPGMLDLAGVLAQLGTELRRAGCRRAARDALRRALDLAVRCRADVLETRVRQDLVATGARPRRGRISGAGSLTPRERQIAELAARGQSNRAIADQLIVSEKTIEWHLANAYRKLEIRGRGALAGSLTEQGQ